MRPEAKIPRMASSEWLFAGGMASEDHSLASLSWLHLETRLETGALDHTVADRTISVQLVP
jgi:hypothetical protein